MFIFTRGLFRTFCYLSNRAFNKFESCCFQAVASLWNSSFFTTVPPQGARPPQLDRSGHATRLSPGTDGTGPAWPGLWALHLQAPVPALPRRNQGRLVQLWAPRGARRTWRPQGLLSQGRGPRSGPEVFSSFVLFPPAPRDSRRLRAALWSSLPLEEVLPAAQRRPSWLGGPGRGPLSPGPCLRPVLFHTCAPHWGHLVMAPHGAG